MRNIQLAVIGGGPAGLRAAETAARAGVQVWVFDGQRSVGRKLLVAGKGGLNLTHSEPLERMAGRYRGPGQPPGTWADLLDGFGGVALREWAAELGVETFVAANGRVYPRGMKAAPLLRRWVARLKDMGVRFEMNHRWSGWSPGECHRLDFSNRESVTARAVVFALGGGSWPQTGSDGGWVRVFHALGIECAPLVAANCGWHHAWPPAVLAAAEGKPIKNITLRAGEHVVSGELLVTRYGLEGGAIYQLGPVLRGMSEPAVEIDFKPTFSEAQLAAKMESARGDLLDQARVRWRLGDAARAILGRREWHDVAALAHEAKHCVVPLSGARPLAEAISSAGGVVWGELDRGLMVRRYPGAFVAGEMVDWEAPTGGYLLQGCFATGTRAGRAAADWVQATAPR